MTSDLDISWEDTIDPHACSAGKDHFQEVSRDPERTPFQWDNSKNSGFSSANKTWLPVAKNYTENNVQLQQSQVNSHLHVFRRLLLLRKTRTMKYGNLEMTTLEDDNVLVYKRELTNSIIPGDIFVIILNFDWTPQTISLKNLPKFAKLPKKMEVALTSVQSTNYYMG